MNIVWRFFVVAHRHLLEWLLVMSLAALAAQLLGPKVLYWWHLPSPGTIGVDNFSAPSLASQYLVYLPASYVGSREWPLVVFLHGSGERGTDLARLRTVKPLLLELPAIVAVPQCLPGYSWQPADVAALVDQLTSRYPVDRQRMYLVGYSLGGFGVVVTAAAYPEKFAAVVPIAGGVPSASAEKLRDVPLWAFHGANDQIIPVTESDRLVEAVKKSGGNPKLTIIPGAGHGISDEVLGREDLWPWLMAQERPTK